ncbi:NADP-dependent oxidoreductase [Cumulibacter soli]|uniref:NADP-dependent oxidoreductase n=1 Tax=Cumulibacter soli TaxID=2546344 RepID=UPI001ABA0B08|nr:NADP-dependent oxidoreductase [Cumulibacter soli]
MRILGFQQYGGPDVMQFMEVPEPAAGSGQLVIDVRASGINPADVKVRNGVTPLYEVVFPMAMGREAAGVITQVGEDVHGFAVGDHVFGSPAPAVGTIAERTVLTAASSAHVPDELSWTEAASIPVSVGTAYDAIDQLALRAGQRLLIIGAGGGVGSAAVQFAVAQGIKVIGAASQTKRDLVERLGARHVASGSGWIDAVLEDGPVDALFDLVGFDTLREGASAVADGGQLVSVASKDLVAELGGRDVARRRTTEVFTQCAQAAVRGELQIQISGVFDFDEAAQGVLAIESGHARGNVVVTREG